MIDVQCHQGDNFLKIAHVDTGNEAMALEFKNLPHKLKRKLYRAESRITRSWGQVNRKYTYKDNRGNRLEPKIRETVPWNVNHVGRRREETTAESVSKLVRDINSSQWTPTTQAQRRCTSSPLGTAAASLTQLSPIIPCFSSLPVLSNLYLSLLKHYGYLLSWSGHNNSVSFSSTWVIEHSKNI